MNCKSKNAYDDEDFAPEVVSPERFGPANSQTPQEVLIISKKEPLNIFSFNA